ncbi:MAG: hypothetical protein K6G69_02455 [Lachnospiraceae bacterium]|nr:hypothetical protein [Lachnospiraceae bacterium]
MAVTYSNKIFEKAARLNVRTAKMRGKVDETIRYTPKDIDNAFYTDNRNILDCVKGNGYWLWKPYFIKKSLDRLNDGDLLIYADAASYYMNDVHLLESFMIAEGIDKLFFSLRNDRAERKYTKRDVFIEMNADHINKDNPQVDASCFLIMKNERNCELIDKWLHYCCDEHLITDEKSVLAPEDQEFITHRHDQSILSVVLKCEGVAFYRDPSQWDKEDNYDLQLKEKSNYPQILNHHRMRNAFCVSYVKFRQTEFMRKVDYKLYLMKERKNVDE